MSQSIASVTKKGCDEIEPMLDELGWRYNRVRPYRPRPSASYTTWPDSLCSVDRRHRQSSCQHGEYGHNHGQRCLHPKTWRIQRRGRSVFVSKHNQTRTLKEVQDFCSNHRLIKRSDDYRKTPTHFILRECPFCSKPTNDKPDNLFKCYIEIGSGAHFCHRCGSKGSWYDFKIKVSPSLAKSVETDQLRNDHESIGRTVPPLPMPSPRLQSMYTSALMDAHNSETLATLAYLKVQRGLEPTTLRKYGVGHALYQFPVSGGKWEETPCITFPWIMSVSQIEFQEGLRGSTFEWKPPETPKDDEELRKLKEETFVARRIKVRSLDNKAWQRLDPSGGGWGLFGYHTIDNQADTVVLTEGEYDAMAVWQTTGMPAVSLPNGCRSLPVEVLPLLERFNKIYLWMDNDAAGQEGAKTFAKKLGLQRTYLVQPTTQNCGDETSDLESGLPKDANEALLRGLDLRKIIDEAKLTPHERIIHFSDLRDEVMHEIMFPEKYVGNPVKSLPSFTEIIQGFRRGEMSVLTGPTGSGKTTFLGQVSMDLVEEGTNVLWGSFEIKNTRLVHKLLQQFAREPLPIGDPSLRPKLDEIADRFSELPYYFMKFHGASNVDDVLDAMEYSVYVNDTEHIILDNMQFMVSLNSMSRKSSFDKFDVQDVAFEKFRKFATEKNVHVTVVVHPRKEQENASLSISSIYGSAKATQEADVVLILQNDGRRKFLEVKKNRFNGTLGHSPLHFDRKSCRYTEAPQVSTKSNAKQQETTSNEPPSAPVPSGSKTTDPWKDFFDL